MKFGTHKTARTGRLVTEAQQGFTFARRTLFLGAAQGAVGLLLAGRMAWLSIFEHDRYAAMAESNRARSTLIPPRRGWIVDRAGKPIAINRSDFRVDLIPDLLQDKEAELALLTRILKLTRDDLDRLHASLDKAAGFQPVQVLEDLDYERFAQINLRLPDLPGVMPARGFSRLYPGGAAVAHLCGYVGSASAEDYKRDHDPLLITPGFKIGKQGLEKVFDGYVRGKPGAKRSEVTARGRLVRELTTQTEAPGATLHLTIDAGLQQYVAERMGVESGSATVIDCTNGDVLAMVSMPAFDPNSFSRGISHDEWDMLSANDHLPLLNKTLQGLYPPGSTVKPMNALALLKAGVSPDDKVLCTGRYKVGNSFFHCYKHSGHGMVDMHRAVQQSCDIYFYAMSRRVGTPAIAAMARSLGLGQRFPLPVTSQRYGTVPDPAWKLHKYGKAWTLPDTLNSSIGQGYTLVNPLQTAVMAARIASGRELEPRLVRRTTDRPAPPLDIDPAHLMLVRRAMGAVVGPGGTANAARLPLVGVDMAGKTGSAQVRRISMADRRAGRTRGDVGAWHLRDHGLFIAFAPVEQPRFAIGVVLEHAGHGSAAAQIARDAITYLYDPEKAQATLARLQPAWGGDIATRMAHDRIAWQNQQAAQKAADAAAAAGIDNAADPAPSAAATAEAPPDEGMDNGQQAGNAMSPPGNVMDE
jgi:penicillin-binding protein 2